MSKRGEQQVSEQTVDSAHELAPLRVSFVPGVTITKWSRIWHERHPEISLEFFSEPEGSQVAALHAGLADVSFVRLPIETEGLSVIRLYDEVAVVVVSSDDPLASAVDVHDDIPLTDLEGYILHDTSRMDVIDALVLVAAGVGGVILPHSIARLHSRKGLVSRTVSGVAPTTISVAWTTAALTPQIEDFVGIVRGRSANSSRANPTPPTAQAAKRAAQKAASANKKSAKSAAAGSQKKAKDSSKKPRTAADDARAKRARVQNGRRKQGR
ncbi:MAG: LysR substrate-binding domain-containing protein [Microbacteriaceae bacterium]